MHRIRHHLCRLLRSGARAIDRVALAISVPAPVIAEAQATVPDHLQACLEREEQRQAVIAAKCAEIRERIASDEAAIARLTAELFEQRAEAERKAREIVWHDHPDVNRNERLDEAARGEWLRGAS